jgi:glycosyltransferase involved in cell wall biosynthesis
MKIGIVVDNELNSDIRVLREIGILKEYGFEVSVLCFGFRKSYSNPLNKANITRINIPRKFKDILFFALNTIPAYEWLWTSHIKKFIIRNNIEILHVHDLYMSRAANKGIHKTKKKIPLILDLHENYPYTVTTYNWTKGFIRRLIAQPKKWLKKEKKYLEYADRIIVLSSDFRDHLVNKYSELSEDKFVVIPNVPDLKILETKEKHPLRKHFKQDFPVIFYYGVIAERRGVFDSLEIFSNLVMENYSVNFLLIGPVDKKDKTHFIKLIKNDMIADRVHYIPWIDSSELADYLETCDICLAPFHKNPQHESGVANKIYEYMLGGKPIIASDCIPQKNLIEKHNCGLVFQNMTEFREMLIRLLNDRLLRQTMGENGYKAVLNEYNISMVKDVMILMYKSITGK